MEKFKSEAEEAEWWFKNQHGIAKEFDEAAEEGRLGRGTVVKQAKRITAPIVNTPTNRHGVKKDFIFAKARVGEEFFIHKERFSDWKVGKVEPKVGMVVSFVVIPNTTPGRCDFGVDVELVG